MIHDKQKPAADSGDAVMLAVWTLLGVFVPGAFGFNYSTMIVGGVISFIVGLYILGLVLKKRMSAQ
jgi:hypothetical protein